MEILEKLKEASTPEELCRALNESGVEITLPELNDFLEALTSLSPEELEEVARGKRKLSVNGKIVFDASAASKK